MCHMLPLRTRHADNAMCLLGASSSSPQHSSRAVSEEPLLSNSESHRATGLDPKTYLVNTQQNCSEDFETVRVINHDVLF